MADNVKDISRVGGASDDRCHASGSSETSSDDFRGHAAGAEGGTGGGDVSCDGRYVFHHFDGLSVSMDTGILVIEAVHIRHEEEVICLDHASGDGREGIIVAKFDFLTSLSDTIFASGASSTYRDRQCVILIDDWNDIHI